MMGKLVGVGEVVGMIYQITNIKYGVFMDMARFREKNKKKIWVRHYLSLNGFILLSVI